MIDETTPRIYVACLAAYNNGCLHGQWIDVDNNIEGIWDAINALLKSSPIEGAEEWAIHGFEGFGSFTLGESLSPEEVIAYANFLKEHGGELGSAVLNYGYDLEEAIDLFEDAYRGQYQSKADFAEQMAGDVYTIPDELAYYIDYERMARDWFMSCDYFSIELGYHNVHVFRNS